MIEGQDGLTWARWKRLAEAVDQLGFAGLFRSDHWTNPEPPDKDSLEMMMSLAYLADRTQNIHFGPLVAPVSMRDPVMLTRQAAALHDLSEGRMWYGLGAGWQDREHTLFGYDLGDVRTRMNRLEEALEVATRLLHSDSAVSFDGRFYQLREATLLPRPRPAGGPPIVVGGNGKKRTLGLAARYANIWNGTFMLPDQFREHSAQLDALLLTAGRQPSDVRRTMMTGHFFGRTMDDLARRHRERPAGNDLAGRPLEDAIAHLRDQTPVLAGTAEDILPKLKAYEAAGVEELMIQWSDLDDIDGLQAFAEAVLPA